ncbi:MAG TPA: hypothetical protein G4N93_02880 [Dehalococcoidia bacterium]|nr:hypothetical protein [Dehalococcoidia bacterium]
MKELTTFDFVFLVEPAGIFGIEEAGKTIISAEEGDQIVSPILDSRTMNIVSWGTQSRLRALDKKLDLPLNIDGAIFRFSDNFLFVSVPGHSLEEAESKLIPALKRLILYLSFSQNTFIRYTLVQATNVVGERIPIPKLVKLGSLRFYNLDNLRKQLSEFESASKTVYSENRISKALEYFGKGLLFCELLEDSRYSILNPFDPLSLSETSLRAETFLNFWKVIAIILGEKMEGKRFQSFYKKLGMSNEEFRQNILPLYKVRNDYDVAHSKRQATLATPNVVTREHLTACQKEAKNLIERYAHYLSKNKGTLKT